MNGHQENNQTIKSNHKIRYSKMIENTKVVVTGGAGFIGSNLVDYLILLGYDVHVIDNLSNGHYANLNPNCTFHNKNICNLEEMINIFERTQYVFHLAAITSVQYSIEQPAISNAINLGGTINVLKAAQESGVRRVIFASSSAVYGAQEKLPIKEVAKINASSPYAIQKYAGEMYFRLWYQLYGLETVILRYFNVYGKRHNHLGQHAQVIAKFLHQKNIGEKITITGSGTQTRDFIHVKDVVDANVLAMLSNKVGHGEAINIGFGISHSINHVANLIGNNIEYIPARFEPHSSCADNRLAKKLISWAPKISLENGINQLKE